MSAAFAETPTDFLQQPHRATGDGWQADIYSNEIVLSVTPKGDALPAALSKLFSPHQLRYWTYVWSHEDLAGWDVYLLTRASADQ